MLPATEFIPRTSSHMSEGWETGDERSNVLGESMVERKRWIENSSPYIWRCWVGVSRGLAQLML